MPLKRGRTTTLERFNQSPEISNFLKEFQEVMSYRLILNQINKYHPDNIDLIVRAILNRPPKTINTKIAGGFLLTCRIEPEMYLLIQETCKKITGNLLPMDELIHLLLSYFIYIYSGKLPKNELPYNHVYKGRRLNQLIKFQNQFNKYYSNTVRSFME